MVELFIKHGSSSFRHHALPGSPKYVWTREASAALSDFLSSWILAHGFDGIYLDGYVQPSRVDFHECALKEQGCQSFIKPGHAYDIDGDGAAETPEEVTASYFAWGPAFVAAMRAKLGAKRLILANSAGAISDSSLSGITIEAEACIGSRGGARKCADALVAQSAATRRRPPASSRRRCSG